MSSSSLSRALFIFFILATSSFAQEADIRVLKPFPSFISIQDSNSETLDLKNYFTGFNLSFSLAPPKVESEASIHNFTIAKFKVISPITQGSSFNQSQVKASYAVLTEENNLAVVQVKSADSAGSILFWDIRVHQTVGSICFDVLNPLPNELWIDCQHISNNSNVLYRLYFNSPQSYNLIEALETQSHIQIAASDSIRSLHTPINAANSEVKAIYRFVSSKINSNFQIDEFLNIAMLNSTQIGWTKTQKNFSSLEGLHPAGMIPFPDFAIIVGNKNKVAVGSLSKDEFTVTDILHGDAECLIDSVKIYPASPDFYTLVLKHQTHLTEYYFSAVSKVFLAPSEFNTSYPIVDNEHYLAYAKVGDHLVTIGAKPQESKNFLTIYTYDTFSPLEVYYHTQLEYTLPSTEPVWLFAVDAQHFVKLSHTEISLYQLNPQVVVFNSTMAGGLITNYRMEVASTALTKKLVRSFNIELHYYKEGNTRIVPRNDFVSHVNIMYPDSYLMPLWYYAYGPALHYEVRSIFPNVTLRDQNFLNFNFNNTPILNSILKGRFGFFEFKAYNHTEDNSHYYIFAQPWKQDTLYVGDCTVNEKLPHLDCKDLPVNISIEGDVSAVILDLDEYVLIETVDDFKQIQTINIYSRNLKVHYKTFQYIGEERDYGDYCTQIFANIDPNSSNTTKLEYVCVKGWSNTVVRYDVTHLAEKKEVAISNFTAKDCGLDSIRGVRIFQDFVYIHSKGKIYVFEEHSLLKTAEYDLSKAFPDLHLEFLVFRGKILAFSKSEHKIMEYFIDEAFNLLESRTVDLYGYEIDTENNFWDYIPSKEAVYFKGRNAYGQNAILVYEFFFDPYVHPLRKIIPVGEPTNNYGYFLRVAEAATSSIALIADSQNGKNLSFVQVHWMPSLEVNSNISWFNPDKYQKSYEFDLKVSSPLNEDLPIDLGFTVYLTSPQRKISRNNHTLAELDKKPTNSTICAPFDAANLFEGTVFEFDLLANDTKNFELKPRVPIAPPPIVELERIFYPELFITVKSLLGTKHLSAISHDTVYQVSSDFYTLNSKKKIKLPVLAHWKEAIYTRDESHMILGGPLYTGEYVVLSVSESEIKKATIQAEDAVITVSKDDDIVFVVASPNMLNFSSSDPFITWFNPNTLEKLGEITFSSVISAYSLNFNESVIVGAEAIKQGSYSYELIILDRSQGLIVTHLEILTKQIACRAINVTDYVKRDLPGIQARWNALKLISTVKVGEKNIYKIVIGAMNFHSYLLNLTCDNEFNLKIDISRGYMAYFEYGVTTHLVANEKFLVVLADIPKSNIQGVVGEYLFFYDLESNNSTINVAWDNYPLVETFQRVKVSKKSGDNTAAVSILPGGDTVYVLTFWNNDLMTYKISPAHQICAKNSESVSSSATLSLIAKNDFSQSVYHVEIGKIWGTPTSTKLWHTLLWLLIVAAAVRAIYFIAKFLNNRASRRLRQGEPNRSSSIYREL